MTATPTNALAGRLKEIYAHIMLGNMCKNASYFVQEQKTLLRKSLICTKSTANTRTQSGTPRQTWTETANR